jgi:hypothetical protein
MKACVRSLFIISRVRNFYAEVIVLLLLLLEVREFELRPARQVFFALVTV